MFKPKLCPQLIRLLNVCVGNGAPSLRVVTVHFATTPSCTTLCPSPVIRRVSVNKVLIKVGGGPARPVRMGRTSLAEEETCNEKLLASRQTGVAGQQSGASQKLLFLNGCSLSKCILCSPAVYCSGTACTKIHRLPEMPPIPPSPPVHDNDKISKILSKHKALITE